MCLICLFILFDLFMYLIYVFDLFDTLPICGGMALSTHNYNLKKSAPPSALTIKLIDIIYIYIYIYIYML